MNLDKILSAKIAEKERRFKKTQEHKLAQQRLRLHKIISSLMFSNGDGPEPHMECREFMLGIVRTQLIEMLIQKARKLATQRGKNKIGSLELVFIFRRHPILIKRLISYVNIADMMPTLMGGDDEDEPPISEEFNLDEQFGGGEDNGTKEEVKEEESTKEATSSAAPSTSSIIQQKPKKKKKLGGKIKNGDALLAAVAEFDVLGNLLDGFGPNWVDPVKLERMHRIGRRVSGMDTEVYKQFANARQMASFCYEMSNNNKLGKTNISMKLFLEWLDIPLLDEGTCCPLILNFCAIEIVAILVESALICRREQEMGAAVEFSDASKNDTIQQSDDEPIKLCHYEEALRRNRGYARRGDLLFGNF